MLTLLIFLAVLSVLVFVHEFGHFIVAKRSGVRVDEFGFGFPPRLVGWKRGDTTYSINWIPMGGFVKLKGESGEAAEDRDSFAAKRVWQRALIVAAGVIMNIVFAAVALSVGFGVGIPSVVEDVPASARVRDVKVVIADVLPDTPAANAGLASGDVLEAMDGERIESITLFQSAIRARPDQPARFDVLRGNERKEFTITPAVLKETNAPGIGVALVGTGIVSYPWYEAPYRGIQATGYITTEIIKSFGQLIGGMFRGRVTVDFSGPVGIAVVTGEVARLGFVSLLQFMALLSVNLAVVNLIPFPALDGGRLLFLAIEGAIRRPVSKRYETLAHQIGFIVLILLVLLITARDIQRLWR